MDNFTSTDDRDTFGSRLKKVGFKGAVPKYDDPGFAEFIIHLEELSEGKDERLADELQQHQQKLYEERFRKLDEKRPHVQNKRHGKVVKNVRSAKLATAWREGRLGEAIPSSKFWVRLLFGLLGVIGLAALTFSASNLFSSSEPEIVEEAADEVVVESEPSGGLFGISIPGLTPSDTDIPPANLAGSPEQTDQGTTQASATPPSMSTTTEADAMTLPKGFSIKSASRSAQDGTSSRFNLNSSQKEDSAAAPTFALNSPASDTAATGTTAATGATPSNFALASASRRAPEENATDTSSTFAISNRSREAEGGFGGNSTFSEPGSQPQSSTSSGAEQLTPTPSQPTPPESTPNRPLPEEPAPKPSDEFRLPGSSAPQGRENRPLSYQQISAQTQPSSSNTQEPSDSLQSLPGTTPASDATLTDPARERLTFTQALLDKDLAPGQKVSARLATGIVIVEGTPMPVMAETLGSFCNVPATCPPMKFMGDAELVAANYVRISWHSVILNSVLLPFEGIALDMSGNAVLAASVNDAAPAAALDVVRATLGGLSNYVSAKVENPNLQVTPDGTVLQESQVPSVETFLLANAADVFAFQSDRTSVIRTAQLPAGTPIQVFSGVSY